MGKSSGNSIKTSEISKGERVRTLRKALGLNMEKFGERIGMAKTSISSIENGYSELTRRVAVAICREYNVSENWLETGEGEMFKEETEETKYYKRLIDEKFATSDDKFRSALLEIILQLDDEAVDVVKRYAIKYLLPAMTGEVAAPFAESAAETPNLLQKRSTAAFDQEGQTEVKPRSTEVNRGQNEVKPESYEPGQASTEPAPLPIGSAYPFEDGQKAADGRHMDGSEPLSVKEEIEIAKKVEDYRRQLRIEKRAEARSSALSGGEEKKEA